MAIEQDIVMAVSANDSGIIKLSNVQESFWYLLYYFYCFAVITIMCDNNFEELGTYKTFSNISTILVSKFVVKM